MGVKSAYSCDLGGPTIGMKNGDFSDEDFDGLLRLCL